MKSPIEVLNDYYVGKTIVEDGKSNPQHWGKTIVSVGVDNYEPMLDFVLSDNSVVVVLFDWKVA